MSIGDSIPVQDLVPLLRQQSRSITARLGDVQLLEGEHEGILNVGAHRELIQGDDGEPHLGEWVGGEQIVWGPRTIQMVGNFLKVPFKYLQRVPMDLQRQILNYHIGEASDSQTTWYLEGHNVAGIYHEGSKIIPLADVADQIVDVVDHGAFARVLIQPDQVEINVISDARQITVPGIEGIESRPMVGDVTRGGFRVIVQPGKPERGPVVQELTERLICTNGAVRMVTGSQINLRGHTVDEVLQEMNDIMRIIWEGLPATLENVRRSAEIPVVGEVTHFMQTVATERGISAANTIRLLERRASLPAEPSVYDVAQIFTDMANEEGLPVKARRSLQSIGGDLLVRTEDMVHRCSQCERPIL